MPLSRWVAEDIDSGERVTMLEPRRGFNGYVLHDLGLALATKRFKPVGHGKYAIRVRFHVWCEERPEARLDDVVMEFPFQVEVTWARSDERLVDADTVQRFNAFEASEAARRAAKETR